MDEQQISTSLQQIAQAGIPETFDLRARIQTQIALKPTLSSTRRRIFSGWFSRTPMSRALSLATVVALLITLGLAASGMQPAPVTAAEILDRAELGAQNPATVGLTSYHAIMLVENPSEEHEENYESDIWYLAPDKLRIELRSAESSAPHIIIKRGAYAWVGPLDDGSYSPASTEHDLNEFEPQATLAGFLAHLQERGLAPIVEGEASIAGRMAYVMSAKPSIQALSEQQPEFRIWIDTEYYVPLKYQIRPPSTDIDLGYTYSVFEPNIPIDDAQFAVPGQSIEVTPHPDQSEDFSLDPLTEEAAKGRIRVFRPHHNPAVPNSRLFKQASSGGDELSYETHDGIELHFEPSNGPLQCTIAEDGTVPADMYGQYQRTGPIEPVQIGNLSGIFCPTLRVMTKDGLRGSKELISNAVGELIFDRDGTRINMWLSANRAENSRDDFISIAEQLEPIEVEN